MIPLRDNIPTRTRPVVNYLMIAVCSVVFLKQVADDGGEVMIERYGMIPARVLDPDRPIPIQEVVAVRTAFGRVPVQRVREAAAPPFSPWMTLLTCIFLHGGWMHFLGNVWFLHIFGDNVEDRFGHWGYVAFYLGSGVAASAVHLLSDTSSTVPTIGASGSIAGVMGAYFLLYPRAKVISLIPIFYFLEVIVLPAPFFLGIWFLTQLFQGTAAITDLNTGGVAWWAHIGGFLAGLAVAYVARKLGVLRAPVTVFRPHTERVAAYRYHRPW